MHVRCANIIAIFILGPCNVRIAILTLKVTFFQMPMVVQVTQTLGHQHIRCLKQ